MNLPVQSSLYSFAYGLSLNEFKACLGPFCQRNVDFRLLQERDSFE